VYSSMPLIRRPIRTELAPGEWMLVCSRCSYEAEKGAASKNECPECRNSPLVIVRNTDGTL